MSPPLDGTDCAESQGREGAIDMSRSAARHAPWWWCLVFLPLTASLLSAACTQSQSSPQKGRINFRVQPPTSRSALGSGSGASGTATFDAPMVDPQTWAGSPIGTGNFSVALSPALSGGPGSVAI